MNQKQQPNYEEYTIKGIKYKWIITDVYGWNISIKKLRSIKLKTLQGSESSGYLLSILLKTKSNLIGMSPSVDTAFFNYSGMILSFKGLHFKCKNLKFAEKIITSLSEGGDYEVFERFIIK